MKIKTSVTWIFLGLLFLGLLSFQFLVLFVTDWWWFAEVGFTSILIKSLTARAILGFFAAVASAAFFISNLHLATRSKTPWLLKIPKELTGVPFLLEGTLVRKLGLAAILPAAGVVGLTAASNWQNILKFLNGQPFGYNDPVFGRDVGFYVFSLPVINFGLGLAKTLIIISLVSSGVLYGLRGLIDLQALIRRLGLRALAGISGLEPGVEAKTNPGTRAHLGILLAFFFAATAASSYLSIFGLVVSQSGPVFGAAFTDANIMVPFLKVSAAVYFLSALLSLFWAVNGRVAPLLGAVSLSVLVGLAGALVPPVFQKLVVAPNELVKETPFIKNNIEATRRAFALDKIEEREITAGKPLTAGDVAANNLTVKNVRLWDRAPLLSTFSQIQEIRTYYEFASVDNDRYLINGEPRQVMLSLRELASGSLPNRSFINERLTFTHGYGLAAGPVNEVTAEGLPVLFVKDLPPKTELKELAVNQPEIYFGELSNDYVFVKTKAKEFDYPKGEENVYTTYAGKAGVQIDSMAKRALYALRFGSLKLFLSNDITTDSRVLYYRNVVERAKKIVPFLAFDRDPYAVVADGRIYWILDAYTASNGYPYSQPLPLNGGTVNYIRNSVKVVVDAYDGTVAFYLSDLNDPIIKTYERIFPGVFKPLSQMSQSLKSHLRYPEDIFNLQTAVYTVYHMDDPQVFYNKEDQWEVPSFSPEDDKPESGSSVPVVTPRHMIMKLPGERSEEYILMLPFTPRAKDNLSAWMVARNDGDSYGKLIVYRFPKDKLVFGPKQIIGRINQEAEISQQISLWDQGGSQVIQGPLLVIPIEESILYVRPLYLKADTGKIPELKRVIVAYENKIAMAETLEEGLNRIFGVGPKTVEKSSRTESAAPPRPQTSPELLRQAQEAYERALRSQKDGDWARYGEEIRALGEILRQMK